MNTLTKEQIKDYNREYYKKNKAKILQNVSNYTSNNKDKVKEYQQKYRLENKDKLSDYRKNWLENNKEHSRKYFRERKRRLLKEDDLFKIKYSIRKRTSQAFKTSKWIKNSSNIDLLGCSFESAKKHIESLFIDGMNWDNYGRGGWHIDHIMPLCSAKTKEEFEKLCKIDNLQPLWEKDNLSKGGKF